MAFAVYNAQGILSNLAIGDWLRLPTLAVHMYGHVQALSKALGAPKDIDTKPEFIGVLSELTHLLEDVSTVVPGEWDDSAAAKFKALVLNDEGSDLLFSLWTWWHELPSPPSESAVGQMMTELAKQIVDPA